MGWVRAALVVVLACALCATARAAPPRSLSSGPPGPCRSAEEGEASFADSELEPILVRDPRRPRRLVAAWTAGTHTTGTTASRDGGRTWRRAKPPGLARCSGGPGQFAGDPWLTFGARGNAYLSVIAGDVIGSTVSARVLVSRSVDAGRTWARPHEVVPGGVYNDKESITGDPRVPGRLHVVWTRRLGGFGENGIAYYSRSDDAARTWSTPVAINAPPLQVPLNNQVLVARDGTLVDVYDLVNYGQQIPGGGVRVPFQVMASRSTDGGRTWAQPARIATLPQYGSDLALHAPNGDLVRAAPLSSRAAARDGTLYVAWQHNESAASGEIRLARSLDAGRTWGAPTVVARPGAQAFQPTVAVASDGRVAVDWFDFRHYRPSSKGLPTDVRIAISRDRGRTWARRRLAPTFDYERAPRVELEGIDSLGSLVLGDYFGLAPVGRGFGAALSLPTAAAKRHRGPADVYLARP
ncbi:MAG TPA: sialidase family protein [Thermoleophilaceae bacterium]|nr:sialidase family protein [Thermoleophilaceae bacterium]